MSLQGGDTDNTDYGFATIAQTRVFQCGLLDLAVNNCRTVQLVITGSRGDQI